MTEALFWAAFILTSIKVEAIIEPIPHRIAGLAGLAALVILFTIYSAALAVIEGYL